MPRKTRTTIDLNEYGLNLHAQLTTVWELSRQCVMKAQKRQKTSCDRGAKDPVFREGERVFLHKPSEKTGEARKLAIAFHGPYRLVDVGTNTASIVRVDLPEEESIEESLHVLLCPDYDDVQRKLNMSFSHRTLEGKDVSKLDIFESSGQRLKKLRTWQRQTS